MREADYVPEHRRTLELPEVTVTATIYSDISTHVVLSVRLRPSFSYWTCPPAPVLRRLARSVANDAGRTLNGARHEIRLANAASGWMFHYPLTAVES